MTTNDRRAIKRVLVSVYDKAGLVELGKALHDAGVEVVSTGGSARALTDAGVPVTKIEDVTGFPEMLDGRVKTLHPKVHGGLLADMRNPDHVAALEEHGIAGFDALVSNLYPFQETLASGAAFDECVEQIDIGGPAMLRAAAKNHASVAVITSPAQYDALIEAARGEGFTEAERRVFAAKTYAHTATYDTAVASWLTGESATSEQDAALPAWIGATYTRSDVLRYGENPHQGAALYVSGSEGVANAEQLHGKPMSYNNYVDTDAAVRAAYDHGDQPTCAVIKHANPCGIAVSDTIEDAHAKAHECDPISAFGGIVATNREVTVAMAEKLENIFTEVVAAPSFEQGALDILTQKKNLRLLTLQRGTVDHLERRPISGGLLVQERDAIDADIDGGGDDAEHWKLVSGEPADDATIADLQFAWRAVRAVKSNGILLARGGASVGVGMGQVNRVDSCHLAVTRAGEERAKGSVAASDAFFPFPDGLKILLDAGVKAVVAPGGSIRDEDVIAAANEAGVTMYFTGVRHFAH